MKKMRLLLSTSVAFVMACGVGLLAAGCNDDPEPEIETYTLAYEKGEGEEGTAPETKSYAAGATVTLAAADTFTKEEYTFTKWLDGTTEYEAGATFTMPERNVTLKAKWQENEPEPEPADPTKLVLGENEYTLGADDVDENGELGRTISFTGKADTNYTLKIEFEALGSLLSVYDSKDTYDAWGDPLLNGDVTETVLTTNGGGTLSLYLNNGTYDAESYEADLNTVTITLTEGANIKYEVGFYDDIMSSTTNTYYEITWGNSFNTEFEGDATKTFPVGEKTGYTFLGWFTYEGEEFDADTIVKSNLKVYAKFVYNGDGETTLAEGENTFTLGLNDVDETDDTLGRVITFTGEADTMYTLEIEFGMLGSLFSVYDSKQTYDDWGDPIMNGDVTKILLTTNGGGTLSLYLNNGTYDASFYDMEDNTVTITVTEGAHIQYTVAFYEDEMSMGGPTSTYFEVTYGNTLTAEGEALPAAPTAPTGRRFEGWFIYDFESGSFGGEFTAETVVTSDMYIVAKWSFIPPTVTYKNGLTGTDEKTEPATEFGDANANGKYTLVLADAETLGFVNGELVLSQWAVTTSAGTTKHNAGESILLDAGDTVTITAEWSEAFTVTFYASLADIGIENKAIVTYKVAQNTALAASKFPTLTEDQLPEGKLFDKWDIARQNPETNEWFLIQSDFTATSNVVMDTIAVATFKNNPIAENYPKLSLDTTNTITMTADDPESDYRYYRTMQFNGTSGATYVFTVTAPSDGEVAILKSGSAYVSNNIWAEASNGESVPFEITISEQGYTRITIYGLDIGASCTIEIALKGAESTGMETLSADELTNSLASYPQYIKKGETLTVTGDVELTDVTATGNGIFVALSNGGSNYVMPAYHNWVYNSQDSQQENAALNLIVSKAEHGFTDSVSGGVWDNYNAMLLKKTYAVK